MYRNCKDRRTNRICTAFRYFTVRSDMTVLGPCVVPYHPYRTVSCCARCCGIKPTNPRMWFRGDLEDGYESNKTGSSSGGSLGWVPGHESTWHSNHTGPGAAFAVGADTAQMTPSPSSAGHWSRSCQLLTPAMSHLGAPSCLDMKDHQPIRRWSSLTKLSSGADNSSSRTSGYQYNPVSQGSLDRGLLYGYRKEPRGSNVDLYLPLSSSLLCHSLLQRSPGAGPSYHYSSRSTGLDTGLSLSSALSSPVRHSSLDMNFSALPEAKLSQGGGHVYGLSIPKQADSPLGHQTDRSSPIQPALRTQMWLTEQMEYRPKAERGSEPAQTGGMGTEGCGGDGPLSWQQGHQQEPRLNQMLSGTSLPVTTLVKVKEGLLRQRELEIDRQKQQILQLHARIRENELRAQQVLQSQRGWFDDPHILNTKESVMRTPCKQPSDRLCCDEDLSRKLAVAELEVLHMNELFKQVTHKYTEDIRKLEDKDVKIKMQTRREKELIASVHSLQQKVQQCLDDGVRLPVQDLKRLEVENTQLLEQREHSNRLIEHQREQIERLTLQLTAASTRLQKKRREQEESVCPPPRALQQPQQVDDGPLAYPLSHPEMPEVGRLLKEMSLCLLDLQALCNILAQRAQGKEPNLSLLLGMKSLSVSAEESDCRAVAEEELRFKLLEVGQLRRDIDELRKSISDRCAQYRGDSCVS
ncbi:hypothetical protein INR49_029915 [Caranx melampygus]|nr:hypothetical protein INR49_029915 [Caranx melampygus]